MSETPSFEPTYRVADDRASDPAAFATGPDSEPSVDQHTREDGWEETR